MTAPFARPAIKLVAALAALLFAACQRTGKAPAPKWEATGKFAGKYAITSSANPGSTRPGYTGSVQVTQQGQHYVFDWKLDTGQSYSGFALETGQFLAAGWGTGGAYGVVVYEITGGRLDGRWASSRSGGKLGSEQLQGPPGPNGSYEIVDSYAPETGKSYSGRVAIQPNGNIYRMLWSAGGRLYSGVGIKKGNLLLAGWGVSGGAVVVYTIREGGLLNGQWAHSASSQLGSEYLKKG